MKFCCNIPVISSVIINGKNFVGNLSSRCNYTTLISLFSSVVYNFFSVVAETEPFDWFSNEKSIDLPIFDNIASPISFKSENNIKQIYNSNFSINSPKYEQHSSVLTKVECNAVQTSSPVYSPTLLYNNTDSKVVSFGKNNVTQQQTSCINTELLKQETLTPPDSPKDEDLLKLLQEMGPEDVEKLVMARADDFSSTVTPFSENSYSIDDELSDYKSSSSYVASDSGLDDPEWSPSNNMKDLNGVKNGGSSTTSKRKNSKPYSKPGVEERKIRKKEQNKNAATRYRMKKKAEVQEIKVEERQLEEKNAKLRNRLEDISREIRYLKSLMRDLYRKKGFIK